MAQPVERGVREAKIAELKRLISSGQYETQEKLEDAVDAFLWSEHDRREQQRYDSASAIARSHPK